MPSSGWLVGARPYLLLVALCLALYLPGISTIPPLDRDEARFTQATRQMLETGDFLRIRFQDEARNKKPAGIYWLQAAAVTAFSTPASTSIWPYRVPSLIGAVSAVVLLFFFGPALYRDTEPDPVASRRIGVIAAVMLASSLGVVAEAHIAKTDAALLAAVMAAQGALGLIYIRGRAGQTVPAWAAIAFWAGEIVAIYLKGPLGLGLAAVTIAALSIADGEWRWLRGLRPIAGIVVMVAVVAPWLIAVQQASDGRFLADSIGQDLIGKLIGPQESHGAPPFAYLLLSVVTFWPGSLLLVPAILRGWRRREAPVERFLLAWLVPAWILLELVPTKLPHYVLPLYPALALLAAAALADGFRPASRWPRRVDLIVKGLWVVVAVGLSVLLIGLPLRFGGHLAGMGVFGALLLLSLSAAILYYRPLPRHATPLMAALSLAFAIPAGLGVMPGLDRLWLSRSAAQLVAAHPPHPGKRLVVVGYSEPSLVFLLGTDLGVTTPRGAAEMLAAGGKALVSNREEPMFRQALSARGLLAQPVGSVPGFDYSNGQRMVLTLYDVAPG